MKSIAPVLSLVILAHFSVAQSFDIANVYPIEGSHSYINFNATYMGYAKVRGRFTDFQGTIYYDEKDATKTSVSFQILTESINTDNDFRDKDLKSDNWFEAEKFPSITFFSNSVSQSDDGLIVNGDLTIKSTTKNISMRLNPVIGPVHDIRGDDQVIFTGSYTVNRKDYGVAGDNWSRIKEGITGVADEVEIEFSMLAKQINQSNLKNFMGRETSQANRLLTAYNEGGIAQTKQVLESEKSENPVRVRVLDLVGYYLLKSNEFKSALEIFLLNRDENPEDASVYDALGEVYAYLNDFEKAKENYQKSLAINADNFNAIEILRHLK